MAMAALALSTLSSTLKALRTAAEASGQTEVVEKIDLTITELATAPETQEEEFGRRETRSGHRTPLSKQRGLERVPTFDGDREKFSIFSKKVMNFCCDVPGLRDMLKKIAVDPKMRKSEIKVEELNKFRIDIDPMLSMKEDIHDMSQELHAMLVVVTNGVPWNLVDGTDGNGWEAWRVLHNEYYAVTYEGQRQLLSKVIQPTRVKTFAEILPAQTAWEAARAKYMETTGKKAMDEDLLITAYMVYYRINYRRQYIILRTTSRA